jgi:hypothetical protein
MKYREEILENKNIRESLVNTDPEFKKQYDKISTIFHNIDFVENENFHSRIDSVDLKTQMKIDEVDKLLTSVNNNEKRSGKKNDEKNYNTNKYDKFIAKYFVDEIKKEDGLGKIKVTKIELGK